MHADRDCYAILGILPEAEDIVVRAAYRALAQRYHPDRCAASADAHARMCELNEAYAILSDPAQRRAYDAARAAQGPQQAEFAEVDDEPAPQPDPFERDWRIATRYCPELATLEDRLRRFSWRLACAFRACLLETRDFDARDRLARLLEEHFLTTHFGTQPRNRYFARNLIMAGERGTALALNAAIRVFGATADPGFFLSRIAHEHTAWKWSVNADELRPAIDAARTTPQTGNFVQLLRLLGGRHTTVDGGPAARGRDEDAACDVEFGAQTLHFSHPEQFRRWGREQLLPLARGLTQ